MSTRRTFAARVVKDGLKRASRAFGVEVTKYRPATAQDKLAAIFSALLELRQVQHDEQFEFLQFCAARLQDSKSQLFQDLFVLFLLRERMGGYFVEFGALDGIALSNTFLLENKYGWSGIVAEPARCCHEALARNRRCSIDFGCVWSKSNEMLSFNETDEAEFSTIHGFSDNDHHAAFRRHGSRYEVETITLLDLLRSHKAPHVIDYLSIDTEGSELEILSSFPFDEYDIQIITVEHNYSKQRAGLYDLLTSRGYKRKFDNLSIWDDWYVRVMRQPT
jgi:FkbM family methyltransferase